MAIFTGGKSTAINSPRHLTLRHAIRTVKIDKLNKNELGQDEEGPPKIDLKPGQEQLFSFWAPSLTAGEVHKINVQQNINPNNDEKPLQLDAEQEFYVEAPRYSLPEGSIYSVYPPPGYTEEARILPHVVLSDPHLPWERQSTLQELPDSKRNRVPWLALLLFAQDELRLPVEDRQGDRSLFPPQPKPLQQSSTQAIRLTLQDLESTKHIVSPIKSKDSKTPDKTMADFIFVKPELFTSLFSRFSALNQREAATKPDTSPYRFLSHVRKINTSGMAVAGKEDIGIFSVVIANRSGPLDYPKGTMVSAHLVSLEGVEENVSLPIAGDTKYAALCSLFSWSYAVTPPNTVNVPDAFDHLGKTLSLLRPPDEVIERIRSEAKDTVSKRVVQRLEDGYSLVKHRTMTGEITVSFFRGPFTPTVVERRWKTTQDANTDANRCSNSGTDLQILDKAVGIMDISYSVAWQVGRMLALADQAFTTALIRLRTAIHDRAMRESKRIAIEKWRKNGHIDRITLLGALPLLCQNLGEITMAREDENSTFSPRLASKRWNRRTLKESEIPSLDYLAPLIQAEYPEQAVQAALYLAMGTDGNVYDETNNPRSIDWMIVLAWVMNRMFFDGIPAHYLVTDPSHLENERLNFFYIDANWTDALIDGALSPGNHLGEDRDRAAIKRALNRYIYEKPKRLLHPPQIPTYGFYLRSDLVSMFPDLKVTTHPEPKKDHPGKAPLLRHEIIADGLMLALLDRVPHKDGFNELHFTQPPHQQRFAAGATLETDCIKVVMRRQYTVEEIYRPEDRNPLETLDLKPSDTDNLFTWGSQPSLCDLHTLRLPHFADVQLKMLQENMGTFKKAGVETKYFDDDTATSALLALQLSDPIYSLKIELDTTASAATDRSDIRTLNLTNPSMVNHAVAGIELGEIPIKPMPEPEPESDSLIANETFDRPPDYAPVPHVYNYARAPHTMPIHTSTAPDDPASKVIPSLVALGDSGPASGPRYKCSISSVGETDIIYIDKDNLQQDLIFSIRVSNNNSSSYRLRAFHFLVPLGKTDPEHKRLFENYTGPGASMLSNLRFNVLLKFLQSDGLLRLSLLPRSTKKWVDMTLVQEMSFLLALAQVNNLEDGSQMELSWQADYDLAGTKPAHGTARATIYHR